MCAIIKKTEQCLDIYLPESEEFVVVLYFHGGSSAGGYISQMLCFDKTWLSKHGIKATDISGFIHDAGQPTCHFNVLR